MTRCRLSAQLIVVFAVMSLTGCTALWPDQGVRQRGASSSLVDFLYPPGQTPPEKTATTRLELPLRVGIGFLPDNSYRSNLTERHRDELLQQIRAHFAERDYIEGIEIIPQTYLQSRGGALAVEQVGRLYDLDVVGLVSYDQAVISDSRKSSLLYWTILGAYVVKGNRNTVSTFVDLAVIDVQSKKLLLRAGGTHHVQKNSTLVDMRADNRKSQIDGFDQAAAQLIDNFAIELDDFEESIKHDDSIDVVHRSGGAGGLGAELLLLAGFCSQYFRRKRQRAAPATR